MKLFVSILLIALFMLQLSFAVDEKYACGATSLYHLATILGIEVSLDKTDAALQEKKEGSRVASFTEIIDCAKEIGVELRGVKLTYEQLRQFNTPVIVHLKTSFEDENPSAADSSKVGHLIVVEHTTDKWVRIFDTPKVSLRHAATVISKDRFLELWTGQTCTLSEKQQKQRQPALTIVPTLHDFGNGEVGEYQTSVQLKNRSGVPLKIIDITTSCNCTVVKNTANVIPANGTDLLDLNWDARVSNRSFFTTVHIQTDTPQRPHTFVSLGLVREFSLVFVPETLYMNNTNTSNIKRDVELQNLSEATLNIQKIESSQEWIRPIFRSSTTIHPWRAADIEINFQTEQVPNGEIDETVTVQYTDNDGKTKTLTLPISGKMNRIYALIPNRFFFGRINATQENTKAVVLNNLSSTNFHIEKVQTDIGTTQVKTLKNEKHYQVLLRLPLHLPNGILKGEVRIHTTHPKMRLIKVPVFALVK